MLKPGFSNNMLQGLPCALDNMLGWLSPVADCQLRHTIPAATDGPQQWLVRRISCVTVHSAAQQSCQNIRA